MKYTETQFDLNQYLALEIKPVLKTRNGDNAVMLDTNMQCAVEDVRYPVLVLITCKETAYDDVYAYTETGKILNASGDDKEDLVMYLPTQTVTRYVNTYQVGNNVFIGKDMFVTSFDACNAAQVKQLQTGIRAVQLAIPVEVNA